MIRWAYKKLVGQAMPVFGVKFKNLKEFTTTKKDRKRGLDKIPGESMRIDPIYDQQEYILEPNTVASLTPKQKMASQTAS